MSKLVLIDGNAILHRAYHALPLLTTGKGEPINAVYGLVSMLLKVITELGPTHIAVCFDRKEPTFRQKIFKDYQIQRPEMDKELSGQIEKAHKTVDTFGIPVYTKAGYEADDIIGSLANEASKLSRKTKNRKSKAKMDEVVIVTGDKDILQLVDDRKNIKVFMPVKGMKVDKLFGEEEVVEKMGVAPKQIVDYKALVGDPSDNYPGVRGIGPKTAEELLSKYKSKTGIYKNLKNINLSTRQKLEKGKKEADVSYQLAKIETNVPIKFDLDAMGNWKIDSKEVLNLFSGFGFKTLTKRVRDVGKRLESEKQGNLF